MKKQPSTARARSKPAPRKPKGRRPQAQRSADTQKRVIDAAIASLARNGYNATTIGVVASHAKVSRGALTHQYPAKDDLMVAVVEAVYAWDKEQYRQASEPNTSKEWLRNFPSLMWEVISKPSGVAVMEIMLASRSDRAMADKLRSVQRGIDLEAHQWVIDRFESAGLKDRPDGDAVHRLFVAAIRGLTLEGMYRRDRAGAEKSVAVLKEIIGHLYPGIGLKPKP